MLLALTSGLHIGFGSLPLAAMEKSAISLAWAIVLFCIILGQLVALNPSRRTREVKRPKEE
jgi:hypothetical protein